MRRVAQFLCPILVLGGLTIPAGSGAASMGWRQHTLWAIFAALMALLQLITLTASSARAQPGAAAGSVGFGPTGPGPTGPAQGASGPGGADREQNAEKLWTIAAIATAALIAYWVIIVLPGVSTNSAFVQTLGVGCAAIGIWLSPGRRL